MSVDMEKVGRLSLVDLSDQEMEVFLKYLSRARHTSVFDFLYHVIGPDEFVRFFDVLSGENIKVPVREEVEKLLGYVQIYVYIHQHIKGDVLAEDIPLDLILKASKNFDRRPNSIKRIYEKVRGVLIRERTDV